MPGQASTLILIEGRSRSKNRARTHYSEMLPQEEDGALIPSTSIFLATNLSLKTKMLGYDVSFLDHLLTNAALPTGCTPLTSPYRMLLIQGDNFALFNPVELQEFLALQKNYGNKASLTRKSRHGSSPLREKCSLCCHKPARAEERDQHRCTAQGP